MAASGFTPISLYYSTTASAVPLAANLANGELALNTADMKLYSKNSAGVVTLLAANVTPVANGGTGLTTTPANGALDIGNGTGFTRTTLTAGTGVTITNASGSITINATGTGGTVTSVAATVPSFLSIAGSPITSSGTLAISLSGTALPTTSGGTGLTSFTANGVVYASSTSALTTGSALTFNGNALGVTGTGGATQLSLTDATSNIGINANPATSAGFYITTTRVGSPMYIRTSNVSSGDVTAMTFVSSGFVGIGVTPTAKLQVSADNLSDGILITGNDNANVKLRMVNSGTGGESWQAQVGFSGASNANLVFRCNTTSTNVLYLTSSGSVAVIGAASTRNMFQVGSANSTLSGWILGNNSAGNGGIWSTSITPSATNYTLLADGANTTINSTSVTAIATSGTTRFQVGALGQFGIGGATYGTSGQVLTSGGASAAPTWSTPTGISTGKSIAMAMIFGF